MSYLADSFRPYWMPGINAVSGNVRFRLTAWLASGDYQMYLSPEQNKFSLNISNFNPLLEAYAHDCSRMCLASFETIEGIQKHPTIPKSYAWIIIRLYYSAFYAAHAILRMLGISCSQIENEQISMIAKIGNLFGFTASNQITGGFYKIYFEKISNSLTCSKLSSIGGGTHEKMWKIFHDTIKGISNEVLIDKNLTVNKQKLSTLLSELCYNLSYGNCTAGNWLSQVRNKTTYRHDYGVWFPYQGHLNYYEELHEVINLWKMDPMNILLSRQPGKDLKRFFHTCCVIVAICRILTLDMYKRCPSGKSFHNFGSIALFKRLQISF
ncbi:MAG: hypothetical protein HY895_05080 [Deltaproteobacteria bacterium]|nr:hypothetical protein [Deltaproteobacteria bacterium]